MADSVLTLCVKNVPRSLPESAAMELFNHFGATAVRRMSKLGNKGVTVFVDFPSSPVMKKAQGILHGFYLGGHKLCVELAKLRHTTLDDRSNNSSDSQQPPPGVTASSTTNNTDSNSGPPGVSGHESVFRPPLPAAPLPTSQPPLPPDREPLAPALGLNYPPPPTLSYRYPVPSEEILQNICTAMVAYPPLYTQVLHLMNKMNLPPPFAPPPAPRPSLPLSVWERLARRRRRAAGLGSDESELESEEEEETAAAAAAKEGAAGVGGRFDRRKRGVGGGGRNNPTLDTDDSDSDSDGRGTPRVSGHKAGGGVSGASGHKRKRPEVGLGGRKGVRVGGGKGGGLSLSHALAQTMGGEGSKGGGGGAGDGGEVEENNGGGRENGEGGGDGSGDTASSPTQTQTQIPPRGRPSSSPPPPPSSLSSVFDVPSPEDRLQMEVEKEWPGRPGVVAWSEIKSKRLQELELSSLPALVGYSPGVPSSSLYIKNLAKGVDEHDIRYLFGLFASPRQVSGEESEFSVRVMQSGRLRGQAFVHYATNPPEGGGGGGVQAQEQQGQQGKQQQEPQPEQGRGRGVGGGEGAASAALRALHGFVLEGKPLVVAYGRARTSNSSGSSSSTVPASSGTK